MDQHMQHGFVTHAISLFPPDQRNFPREFLEEFIGKISNSDEEFPISIGEFATWIDLRKDNIVKLIKKFSLIIF